jgi:hypothetical protein
MILIAMPSCCGLGLVVLARSMRRTSAALSVCWARFPRARCPAQQDALQRALSSSGLRQTRLPSATGRRGGVLSRRAPARLAGPLIERVFEDTYWLPTMVTFGTCHWQVPFLAIECSDEPEWIHRD